MHPGGGNPPDKRSKVTSGNPNGPVVTPESLAQYRNTLFNPQALLPPPNNPQQMQFLAQMTQLQQQALANQLQSPLIQQQLAGQNGQIRAPQPFIAQNGNAAPMTAFQQQLAQQHHQQIFRHHQHHQHQVEAQRQAQEKNSREQPRQPHHEIDERNQTITITFTTQAGTTSVTVPASFRSNPFTRVQHPHISALFLEQMIAQYQLLNPFHCHKIEVPGLEGGLVYYHPTALLSILNGVLEQVETMYKTFHQIVNNTSNPLASVQQVSRYLPDIQKQAAKFQRNVNEAQRRGSLPAPNLPPMRNNAQKKEDKGRPLVVTEPTRLSPRNEQIGRDHPIVPVPTTMSQEGLKRPVPNNINDQLEAAKRARPDIFEQIGHLQAAVSAQFLGGSIATPMPYPPILNNTGHLPPPPTPLGPDSLPLSPYGSHAGDSAENKADGGGKPQKKGKGKAKECPALGENPLRGKIENISPELGIIGENIISGPNITPTNTELIDKGTAQRPPSNNSVVSLQRISSEEQTATEVLVGLGNQATGISPRVMRTQEGSIFIDLSSLTLEERVNLLPGPSQQQAHDFIFQNLLRATKHQCSMNCPKDCTGYEIGP